MAQDYIPREKVIVERAESLRKRTGIHDQRVPNLDDFLNRLPRIFPGYRVKVIEARANKVVKARVSRKNKTLYIRDDVYAAVKRGDQRARRVVAQSPSGH